MKKSFPWRPPKEAGFSYGPDRPEKTTCDGRESSRAEHLKPTVADTGRNIYSEFYSIGDQMGEVVQFIPKRDLKRARLIEAARAIYESIFPTEKGPAGR